MKMIFFPRPTAARHDMIMRVQYTGMGKLSCFLLAKDRIYFSSEIDFENEAAITCNDWDAV